MTNTTTGNKPATTTQTKEPAKPLQQTGNFMQT